MKKLTKKEANSIKTKPDGRINYTRGVLMAMNKGEVLLLEPNDWSMQTRAPSTYCLMLGRKVGMEWSCKTALDGSGWVIERVQ